MRNGTGRKVQRLCIIPINGRRFILIFADNTSSDVFDNDWEMKSEKESDFMSKIMIGDKVRFNGKYED